MSVVLPGGPLSPVPWAGRPASAIVAERNLAIAVVVSLLAHAAFFAIPLRQRAGDVAASAATLPLNVRIVPAAPAAPGEAVAVAPVPPPARPPPAPKRPEPAAPALPVLPAERAPEPAPAPAVAAVAAVPPIDMSQVIQANRERRRLREAAILRELEARSAAAGRPEDSGLARNLESLARADGTGGVFHITRLGMSSAEFAFNGWNRTGRGRWREYIQVEVEPGGDIERAVVRRMIALVREHYSGDFRWESYRLGRTVTLSAAPPDNDGLEEFLMREFFGTPLARRGR